MATLDPFGPDPLAELARLWSRERRATQARFAAERRELPLSERVAQGLALRDLRLDETSAAAGGRLLVWLSCGRAGALDHLRIGPGDPVRLWWEDPEEAEAIRGVFTRRRGDRLGLMVEDRDDTLERLEGSGFRLDRDEPMATFDRGDKAIAQLAGAPRAGDLGRLRELLLGQRRPERRREAPPERFHDRGLNPAQQAAVVLGLDAAELALIHGPPGTGKTRTLVELAWQAQARGERVLACAASNAAVDHLAEGLLAAGIELVRLGHPARVSPAIEPYTLDALVEAEPDYALAKGWMAEADRIRRRNSSRSERGLDRESKRAAYAEANGLSRDARRQLQQLQSLVLDRARVVCATAAGSDSGLLGDRGFDLVLLDEASQAVDPILLVPLVRARRAVLAGDHRQLPPTVIDPQAGRDGLASTWFERLAEAAEAEDVGEALVARLAVQHRMHQALMAFPSDSMYAGSLIAADSVARQRLEGLPGLRPDPLRPGPLVFVDTAGKGWDEARGSGDPSTHNPEQAARVAAELRRLLSRGLAPEAVGLITPYRAQARLLRELLAPERAAGLEIDTVDAFQGREKEAILVDLVRANPDCQLGFLADTRRMNVALTRARRFLLVVGDSATIGAHPYYAAFLAAAESAGAWISAWSDEAPPL